VVFLRCDIDTVSGSNWVNLIRNVPTRNVFTVDANKGGDEGDNTNNNDNNEGERGYEPAQNVVIVSLAQGREGKIEERLPSLVLVGLKYRGNIGTIVRAAVQADCFQSIVIVEEREEATKGPTKVGGAHAWEKHKNKRVSNEDVCYYSLCNAPLIHIQRVDTVVEFFALYSPAPASIVAVDGGTNVYGAPLSLFEPLAREKLGTCDFVCMGSEDHGVPDAFLEKCGTLLMIPCLSASINVSCAFAMVLAVMLLAREEIRNR
jgi:tRNA G18 (ribose-2'-O)-methylase SpoU